MGNIGHVYSGPLYQTCPYWRGHRVAFLAVLFGILGGVETLGLLGLFVGPIVMVLFITLWHESQNEDLNGRV